MESVSEILTPLLALYGAALSTYVFYKNMQSRRPTMFVSHGWSYDFGQRRDLDWFPVTLNLHAVNHGQPEIVVSSLGLEIPEFCIITPNFVDSNSADESDNNKYEVEDKRLHHGDRIEVVFDYGKLLHMLHSRGVTFPVRVRAVCEDSLENFYFSTWFEIGRERRQGVTS